MAQLAKGQLLTPKQAMFVREYMIDLNATRAAIRAGYSKKTAAVCAHEYLSKPNIKTAIGEEIAKLELEKAALALAVRDRLRRNSFSDMKDYAEWDKKGVRLKPSKFLGPESSCISELISSRGETRVKLHDQNAALDKLARHLGMYADEKAGANVQVAIVINGVEADL